MTDVSQDPKVSHGQGWRAIWGAFFGWDMCCVSECLENKQQTTGVVWPGSIENGGAAAMWRLLFLFFFDGKLAAMEYSKCL